MQAEETRDETKGTWPDDCVQRAFVRGTQWWQFRQNSSTMFGFERREAEAEAVERYGQPTTKTK